MHALNCALIMQVYVLSIKTVRLRLVWVKGKIFEQSGAFLSSTQLSLWHIL